MELEFFFKRQAALKRCSSARPALKHQAFYRQKILRELV
jgi:hypothetical protein